MTSIKTDIDTVQDRLKTWFEKKLSDASELSLSLDKDHVGGSNETFFLDLRYQAGGERKHEKLVIRWPPRWVLRRFFVTI